MKNKPVAHTETPWKQAGSLVFNPKIDAAKRFPIVDTARNGIPLEQQLANAAFIVRAVNAHEELLEALQWAYDEAKRFGYFNQTIEDRIAKAEAAC